MTQLLQNAAYGTALILAAAALRRVLKNRLVPGVRLTLWAVCLLRLLTPAAPESVLSLWGLFRPRQTPAAPAPAYAPVAGTPQLYTPTQAGPSPASPAIPWETVLLAVWLAVGIALAARYVLSWRRTRRAVVCAIPVGRDDPRYLPLPKCARLREGPMEGAPLTFGAVKPTVVLSPGLEGGALDCVLAHEGVHASRRDNLWHYVMALALVLHWWNPAVWLMARLLRRDIELSCDRAAVKKLGMARRAEYANTLVTLATRGGGPTFCHTFGRKATEERILYIMKFKKTSILSLALSLLLVGGVTVAFASKPVEPRPNPEPDPEPTVTVSVQDYFDSVSGLTEEELAQLVPRLEQMRQSFFESLKQAGESDLIFESSEQLAAQSNCPHLNTTSNGRGVYLISHNESMHIEVEELYQCCNDCSTLLVSSRAAAKKDHSFGAGTYVEANHSLPDPSQHTFTYSHTCADCENSFQYTVPSGCQEDHCVDINSVTPEPDVSDDTPSFSVELADRDPDNADLADALEEQMEHLAEELLTQVYTAPVTPSDHH